jgi:hypothetical protein
MGGVGEERLGKRYTRSNSARLESAFGHRSTRDCGLLDATGIGLFLFLVSQWRQHAWIYAIPWALEILGQDCCVHTRREYRLERIREGQMAAVASRLGGVSSFFCVRNLHVGHGLIGAFSWTRAALSSR